MALISAYGGEHEPHAVLHESYEILIRVLEPNALRSPGQKLFNKNGKKKIFFGTNLGQVLLRNWNVMRFVRAFVMVSEGNFILSSARIQALVGTVSVDVISGDICVC